MDQFIGRWLVNDDVNGDELTHIILVFDAPDPDAAINYLIKHCHDFATENVGGRLMSEQIMLYADCQLLSDGPLQVVEDSRFRKPASYRTWYKHL